MIPGWLLSNMLWLSLILLLASALADLKILASLGWMLFGMYWIGQPGHYIVIEDYFNAVLALAAAFFCFYLGWIILTRSCQSQACAWATYAAALCGIVYFPFAEIEPLKNLLIAQTTLITVGFLHALSVPVYMDSWNVMVLNGYSVEIVLACTAIESIALFVGIIASVRAPMLRRFAALLGSTMAIYLLNIVRNAFVLTAYGWQLFGNDSFYMAHNVISKIGSTFALLAIAYFVLSLLPELLTLIDELAMEMRRHGGDAA